MENNFGMASRIRPILASPNSKISSYEITDPWWDKQGGNEIDVVALDEFSHTGLIAEVKRNERKLSMPKLEEKVARLPAGSFGKYHFELKGLSIENM